MTAPVENTIAPKPDKSRSAETTDRILEAAATLFAEHGYNGVSIRMIVREAGVHISSLYHRYASKAELLEAVFRWYLEPMRREREALFADYLAWVGDSGAYDPKKLLAIMFGPAMRLAQTSDTGPLVSRLAGFFGTDPSPDVQAVIARIYNEEMKSFMELLRRSAPSLSDAAFFWAACSVYGTLIYVQSDLHRVRDVLQPQSPAPDGDALDLIADFLAGGMKALEGK